MKLVDASEFEVSKKTVASTKLTEGDSIVSILPLTVYQEEMEQGVFLMGGDDDIPEEEMFGFPAAQEMFSSDIVVLQTEKGFFLRFKIEEVPEKKKNAIGVRGMKLAKEDVISHVYLMDAGDNLIVEADGTQVELRKLKLKKRDQTGQKIR